MNIDDGGQAFPVADQHETNTGMTLRDYFAGQALKGMLCRHWPGEGSHFKPWHPLDEKDASSMANMAYTMADAMLVERGHGTEQPQWQRTRFSSVWFAPEMTLIVIKESHPSESWQWTARGVREPKSEWSSTGSREAAENCAMTFFFFGETE